MANAALKGHLDNVKEETKHMSRRERRKYMRDNGGHA